MTTPRERARREGVPESQLQYYPDTEQGWDDAQLDGLREEKTPRLSIVRQGEVEETAGMPSIWTASQMSGSKPVTWLARHRIPRGGITVLVGDEGIGKSLMWVWLAAAITTGRPIPEYGIKPATPGHVILLLAENGWADMDRPRLEAAGADLDYIHPICVDADGTGAPAFTPYVQKLIAEAPFTPTLVVADPWLDTVPGNLTVKDGQQAKQSLRPWRELAVRDNCAVLLVAHTNRTSTSNTRDKYGATAELRKTARMTLLAQYDDEADTLSIGPDKSNLIPRGLNAAQFKIDTQLRPGWEDGVPVLRYVGEASYTAAELLETSITGPEDVDIPDARNVVLSILESNGGWAEAKDIRKAVEAAGLTWRTVQRNRHKWGIETDQRNGGWVWSIAHKGT